MNNDYNDYLMHYGIKGQKWGERRYQNEDGTLTPEGIERYRKSAKGRINAAAEKFNGGRSLGKTIGKTVWSSAIPAGAGSAVYVLGAIGSAAVGGLPGALIFAGSAAADLALTALSVRNTAVGIDASIRKGMQNSGKIETISGLPKDYKKKD